MRQRTPGGSPNINDKEKCIIFVYKENGEKTSNFLIQILQSGRL